MSAVTGRAANHAATASVSTFTRTHTHLPAFPLPRSRLLQAQPAAPLCERAADAAPPGRGAGAHAAGKPRIVEFLGCARAPSSEKTPAADGVRTRAPAPPPAQVLYRLSDLVVPCNATFNTVWELWLGTNPNRLMPLLNALEIEHYPCLQVCVCVCVCVCV